MRDPVKKPAMKPGPAVGIGASGHHGRVDGSPVHAFNGGLPDRAAAVPAGRAAAVPADRAAAVPAGHAPDRAAAVPAGRAPDRAAAVPARSVPDPVRRHFLKAAPLGALAVVAGTPPPAAAAPLAAPAAQVRSGYHETEHIRRYYQTAAYW